VNERLRVATVSTLSLIEIVSDKEMFLKLVSSIESVIPIESEKDLLNATEVTIESEIPTESDGLLDLAPAN